MKKLWIKISSFIKKLYSNLVDESKEHLPLAITVVEGIKQVLDSQVDDIVLSVIQFALPNVPINKVNIVKAKLEEALPKIILEMNLINAVVNIENTNDQLQAILDALKLSKDDVKAEKYHTIASKVLVVLSDGKVSWGESVMFTEWYYQNYVKK